MPQRFFHSGDLGDVIYSLPTIKAMGGGELYLYDDANARTAHGMTIERYRSISPLLYEQEYIENTSFCVPSHRPFVNLNRFRGMGLDLCSTNLADLYLRTEGLPTSFREKPWLKVSPNRAAAVIISRSARYHNDKFPWKKVMQQLGKHAAFVGTPDEHAAFVQEFGDLPHYLTYDLLAVAQVIAGADLFIGNQSAPLAIAHGLGQKVLIEVCPYCPNCIFKRKGEYLELEKVCLTGFRERSSTPAPCTVS